MFREVPSLILLEISAIYFLALYMDLILSKLHGSYFGSNSMCGSNPNTKGAGTIPEGHAVSLVSFTDT